MRRRSLLALGLLVLLWSSPLAIPRSGAAPAAQAANPGISLVRNTLLSSNATAVKSSGWLSAGQES